jgi:hypothetical protein
LTEERRENIEKSLRADLDAARQCDQDASLVDFAGKAKTRIAYAESLRRLTEFLLKGTLPKDCK